MCFFCVFYASKAFFVPSRSSNSIHHISFQHLLRRYRCPNNDAVDRPRHGSVSILSPGSAASALPVSIPQVLYVTKVTFDPFHYSFYPTTLLGLLSDQSVPAAPKLDTTATSIDAAASTRIEIAASPRIEIAVSPRIKTTAPEVVVTSFDLCAYYFAVIRDSRRSF